MSKAVIAETSEATVYIEQGKTLSASGQKQAAIAAFDKAISINPNLLEAYFNKGDTLDDLGKKQEAVECYNKAISINPNLVALHINKGNTLSDLGDNEGAIECYNKAISINPNDADAYLNKGAALSALDDNKGAIECYNKAIEIDPNYATIYYNKGAALSALGDNKGAIECYNKAIVLNPNYANAYRGKGNALSALDNNKGAIECFNKAIVINPNDSAAYNSKGTALYELSKVGGEVGLARTFEALAAYDQAIKLAPQEAIYYCNRGIALNSLGREQEALENLNKAYSIAKSGNLGSNLSQGNIAHINQVLSEDREVLLKKITELQKTTIEAQGVVDSLDQNNQAAKKVIEQFKQIKQAKTELTAKVIEGFNATPAQAPSLGQVSSTSVSHASSADFTKQIAEMHAQLTELIKANSMLQGKVHTMDQALKGGNCFFKQTIRDGFEVLKTEAPNQVLYNYANNFYWALGNYLLAYRAIASGAVAGVRDKNQLEKMWDKVGSAIITATDAIPVVGGMLALIEEGIISINDAYKDMKFDRKVAKINELMTGFMLEEDLNLAIAGASIQVAMRKRSEIVEAYQQKYYERKGEQKSAPSTVKKTKDIIEDKVEKFNAKIEATLAKITKIKTSDDTVAKVMAVKDVILFINYIATHEVVLISSQGGVASLDRVIAEVFTTNIVNTDRAIREAIAGSSSKTKQDKCVVSMLNKIIYDNPLLNHPELLKEATSHFGFSKALDLSESLNRTLVFQAIETNDQELILAGMMSLVEPVIL
jgi:tetratricopeptide (TPR) repeat protein